jgi:hypothetical protein
VGRGGDVVIAAAAANADDVSKTAELVAILAGGGLVLMAKVMARRATSYAHLAWSLGLVVVAMAVVLG